MLCALIASNHRKTSPAHSSTSRPLVCQGDRAPRRPLRAQQLRGYLFFFHNVFVDVPTASRIPRHERLRAADAVAHFGIEPKGALAVAFPNFFSRRYPIGPPRCAKCWRVVLRHRAPTLEVEGEIANADAAVSERSVHGIFFPNAPVQGPASADHAETSMTPTHAFNWLKGLGEGQPSGPSALVSTPGPARTSSRNRSPCAGLRNMTAGPPLRCTGFRRRPIGDRAESGPRASRFLVMIAPNGRASRHEFVGLFFF